MERLLCEPFPGRDEIRAQVAVAEVRVIDADGSLRFRGAGPAAVVSHPVPVTGRYLDGPGDAFSPHVKLCLHVVEGRVHELDVYKDDGTTIVVGFREVAPGSIGLC